jgi:hypothetical protein
VADREKLAIWVKSHVNLLFVAGMAVLLLLRGMVFMTEGTFLMPEIPKISVEPLTPTLTIDSDLYKRVRHLIEPRANFEKSPFWVLAEFNMFDPKLAQSAEQITQQANQFFEQANRRYAEAMQALRANNRQRAEQLFNEALGSVHDTLDRQPTHARAKKLKQEIQNQLTALKQPPGGQTPPGKGAPGTAAKPVAPAKPATTPASP